MTQNKTLIFLALIMAPWCVSPDSLAGDESNADWQTRKVKNEIEVAQRPVVGSKYFETRGEMRSNASLFSILAVLRDAEACAQWLYKCKQGKVVNREGASSSITYMVIDAPLMLKDRDMYVRSTVSYLKDENEVHIDLEGAEDFGPQVRKRVRVLDFHGHWALTQTEEGPIELVYQVYSNPQVSPAKPANSTMVTSVLDTLGKVDRLAQQEPYKNASFSDADIAAITVSLSHP